MKNEPRGCQNCRDGMCKGCEDTPLLTVDGVVEEYRKKMDEIGMKSEWQVGDEWLRERLTALIASVREEEMERIISLVSEIGEGKWCTDCGGNCRAALLKKFSSEGRTN